MSQWMQLISQDVFSPIMEEFHYFHDFTNMILLFILIFVGFMMISMLSNKIILKGLLEGQMIEFIWSLIPALILIQIALPSLTLPYLMGDCSLPNLTIKAIGHQWYWEFNYSDFWINDKNVLLDSYVLLIDGSTSGDSYVFLIDGPTSGFMEDLIWMSNSGSLPDKSNEPINKMFNKTFISFQQGSTASDSRMKWFYSFFSSKLSTIRANYENSCSVLKIEYTQLINNFNNDDDINYRNTSSKINNLGSTMENSKNVHNSNSIGGKCRYCRSH